MDAEELTHEVPFPLFLRGMFLAIGIFAIVLPAWELWRGVWPPNIFSPFFALIIAGAWSVGGAAVWAAVFGASATMVFRRGQLEVRELYLRSKRTRQFGLAEIGTIATEINRDSDGPDTWQVHIRMRNGEIFSSRNFDTEATARKWEAAFRGALGC